MALSMAKHFHIIFFALIIFALSSCSGNKDDENKIDLTAEELYSLGKQKLDEGSYKGSIEQFQEIERLYPFSKLATKAQVMIAYTYYKDEEYDDAVGVIDRFVKYHPGNEDVQYMYYLKALCYYDRIVDVKRDQKVTQKALESLEEIVRRFPESKYERDAKLKIDLVHDHLAGKEMEIGRFYLKSKKFIAALNRFKKVIEKYETTSHAEEALYRMTEAYLSLGLEDEARKNAAVLGHNFPKSKWYKYAYRIVEEGKDSPIPVTERSWFKEMLTFQGSAEVDLPKDDKADSWVNDLINIF